MTYAEYRKQEQAEFDALPIFLAFSDEQLERAMNERGLTLQNTDKIYRFGRNGFYLKTDDEIIKKFVNRPDRLRDLMENEPGFAEDAFYYEMENHEYSINWQGDYDVCSCFGRCKYDDAKDYVDYLEVDCGYSGDVIDAFLAARTRFYRDAQKNDWY